MTNPHDKAIEAARDAINAVLARDSFAASSGDMAEAAIAAYERAMWRPIEEAPRESDGEDVIVVGGRYAEPTVVSSDGAWWALQKSDGNGSIPTHFRPLPPVPEGE